MGLCASIYLCQNALLTLLEIVVFETAWPYALNNILQAVGQIIRAAL